MQAAWRVSSGFVQLCCYCLVTPLRPATGHPQQPGGFFLGFCSPAAWRLMLRFCLQAAWRFPWVLFASSLEGFLGFPSSVEDYLGFCFPAAWRLILGFCLQAAWRFAQVLFCPPTRFTPLLACCANSFRFTLKTCHPRLDPGAVHPEKQFTPEKPFTPRNRSRPRNCSPRETVHSRETVHPRETIHPEKPFTPRNRSPREIPPRNRLP